jgi:hypothetical protein
MNPRRLRRIRSKWAGISLLLCSLSLVTGVSAAPCLRTEAEQNKWIAVKVNALILSAQSAYRNDNAQERYERVVTDTARIIRRCNLAETDFLKRYPEFVEYVNLLALGQQDDHELGFIVPDSTYFAETREYVTIPAFLLSQKFLRSVSRFENLSQAKALLREMNAARAPNDQLSFLSYESRHLGTPDNPNSFRRLLIVVPGNAATHQPEKWVQFGITDPGARVHVRNVSVVATLPGANGTTNTYFKDYFRTYHGDGSITINGRWELGYGDDNCVQCHKSGVLPIFPVAGTVKDDEQKTLASVNERFLSYGAPRFDRYLDASKFGPGLGSFSSAPVDSPGHGPFNDRIAASSRKCASCHKHDGLGALNWPMDEVLVQSFVKGGLMPLGDTLQNSERAVLYKKLINDYFSIDDAHPGILKSWLLGKSHQELLAK